MRSTWSLCVLVALAGPAFAQVSLWSGSGSPGSVRVATATAAGPSAETPGVATSAAGVSAAAVAPRPVTANLAREMKSRNFEIHEIVSIIVSVSAQASTDEATGTEKKSDKNQLAIDEYLKLSRHGALGVDLKGSSPDNLGISLKSDRKSQNFGQNDRSDTLRTRIAAEIVDKKPNGNLVIEARHQFTKQGETTKITLSGVVRPQDVQPDNVVYSYNVADADIRYESSGPITDASRRGWLAKVFDKIWPF